jgi:hypothetical protein
MDDEDDATPLIFLIGEDRVEVETGLKGLWSFTDYDTNRGTFYVPFNDAMTAIECLRLIARQIEREG